MKRAISAACLLLLTFTLLAQNPPAPPKPAPELARLKYFEGTWATQITMQPGPWGPGGKASGTDHLDWGLGGFFLLSHSVFKGGGMDNNAVAYFGYDSNKKAYTYDEYNSMGEVNHSTGNVNDKTWTWTNEMDMGGQKINGRFILVETSPTSYTMKYEFSTDGGKTWNTAMEGTGTKQGDGSSTKKK